VELILYAVSQLVQRPPEIQIQDPAQTFQDEAAMFRWCREAAERFIVAQYVLGELYRDGRGVPRDLEAAHMWFSIAEKVSADMESKSGQAKRALESALGPQLVHQSTRNAAEWLRRQKQLSTVHIEVNPMISAA
jgi:localization factor PodJL